MLLSVFSALFLAKVGSGSRKTVSSGHRKRRALIGTGGVLCVIAGGVEVVARVEGLFRPCRNGRRCVGGVGGFETRLLLLVGGGSFGRWGGWVGYGGWFVLLICGSRWAPDVRKDDAASSDTTLTLATVV
ncbi:hypothetical protein BYT27DRAFT_7249450 [Phlegmacium glaucopus]|nr:hypothetical protein BYT27DRAFT_7249450 [Phlegmacium glaucopus]